MNEKIFFFCLAFALSFAFGSVPPQKAKVRWEDFSEALEASRKDHKLVFVDLYAEWCIPCQIMAANAFMDDNASKILNTRFHPVRLNIESGDSIFCDHKKNTPERCFFDVWGLNGVPSFVLISPKGLTILTLTQTLEASELRALLFQFLEKEKDWLSE